MSIMRRIADRFDRPETRAADPSWAALSGWQTAGGQRVDAGAAEGLATVYAATQAIASGIASLPVNTYTRTGGNRVEAPDHPVARLVRNGPNRHQNWPDFVEFLIASALLRGNALAEITITGELVPHPWDRVSVVLLPSGRLAFDVSDAIPLGGTGRIRRLLDTETIYLKDRSDDGLVGRSRLSRVAATVGAGLATQSFAANLYTNGAFPSGVLEAPGPIGDEALRRLRKQFTDAFTGPRNAAKAMILEAGIKWNSISISPEDAELLASRKFSAEELARIFQVPPPLVGIWDHSSFTNSETAGRWFAVHTLAPWCRKIEAELGRKLLGDGAEIEIDLSGLLRGSPQERWATYDIALKHQVLTANEIRQVEGWNPRPAGDGPAQTAVSVG